MKPSSCARGVLVLLFAAAPSAARAERLFAIAEGTARTVERIARVQTLALDPSALASLRVRSHATLTEFPLGGDATVTLDVQRFEVFSEGAEALLVEAAGPRTLPLPDQLYFRGTVAGDPASRALVIASRDAVKGLVASGGTLYRFGRDRTGVYRSWALRDADPSTLPTAPLCTNDVHHALVATHPGHTGTTGGETAASPPTGGFPSTLQAEVYVETDQELLGLFSNSAEALTYLADLGAAVSAIYDADTQVRVKFRTIRLWNTPDPWSGTSTDAMLQQLVAYWTANQVGIPRDVVHFISGKGVVGGLAFLDVLCDPAFGYGVSTVYGSFDVMNPNATWDVIVVAHELGHNFGSPHTHCYVPPVDMCYGGEPGCYSGPTSTPPGGGTIMSYCQLRPGGISNVNLTFGTTVSAVLRTGAENGVCIGPPCGDGILDPGEECDDGNITNGDCCSATCTAEANGNACSDDEACTSGDHCSGGSCVGTPVANGTPCADETSCTADTCQGGVCVGVPTLATGCRVAIPQRSQLTLKDKSSDKSDQVTWTWAGQATWLQELGSPLATDDYELCVYGPGPSLLFHSLAPAGGSCRGKPCWKAVGTRGYAYQDKDRTPDGMDKLALTAGDPAKASAKGKGVLLDMPTLGSLPLPLRAQLRGAGECWEATYSTAPTNTSEQFKAKSD